MAQRKDNRAKSLDKIALGLETLFRQIHHKKNLSRDPLGLVSTSLPPDDFELVSFVSAGLSYGRVEQIQKSLTLLWKRMELVGLGHGGKGLHALLVDNSGKTLKKEIKSALKGWGHRFNKADDMVALFGMLKTANENFASIGEVFVSAEIDDPENRIQVFTEKMRKFSATSAEKTKVRWFTCAPAEGSTCKRMMMWLRWMLRADEIDPGLWSLKKVKIDERYQRVGPEGAFIPMDTHIYRWAKNNDIVSGNSPSWKSVIETTKFLRKIDPKDPVRFDFSICQSGMLKFRDERNF